MWHRCSGNRECGFLPLRRYQAERLRSVLPRARILMLSSPLPFERAAYHDLGVEICCSDVAEIADLAELGRTSQRPVQIHLSIDTGMGRTGCLLPTLPELLPVVQQQIATGGLLVRGVMSHYASALQDKSAGAQEAQFATAVQAVTDALGPDDERLIHLANSAGLLERPAIGNAVRVGLLWTGCLARPRPEVPLRPVITWSSRLSLIKHLPAGHGVSYGSQFICDRPMRVGLVPVGYADGYPLTASGKAEVVVAGQRCAVLGQVTMDYLIVAVPDAAVVGDEGLLGRWASRCRRRDGGSRFRNCPLGEDDSLRYPLWFARSLSFSCGAQRRLAFPIAKPQQSHEPQP